MRNKYPPFIFSKKSRLDHIKALSEADKSDLTKNNKEDYFSLVQFGANEMIE